jgi:hypothetical protein
VPAVRASSGVGEEPGTHLPIGANREGS